MSELKELSAALAAELRPESPGDGGGVGLDARRCLRCRVGGERRDDLPEGRVVHSVAQPARRDQKGVSERRGEELAPWELLVVGIAAAGHPAPDVDLRGPPNLS